MQLLFVKLLLCIKLFLLRHGESIWNSQNRFTGWVDIGLSEIGIKEAKQAGNLLKKKAIPLT